MSEFDMDTYMWGKVEDLYKAIIAYVEDMASVAPKGSAPVIDDRVREMISVIGGYKRQMITEDEAFSEIKKIYMGL